MVLTSACVSKMKIAEQKDSLREPAQYLENAHNILVVDKIIVGDEVPDHWFAEFQNFLKPSQKILEEFGKSSLKPSTVGISWGKGRLTYNPSSPSILEIGWPTGCKSLGTINHSFVLSMHEVGHIVLGEYLRSRYQNLYLEDQKLDFWGPIMSTPDISKPYEEAFADAFVVFSYLDPEIMTKSINACGIDTVESASLNARSFSQQIDLAHWKDKSVHSLFDPTRVYVYKTLYLNSFKEQPEVLLKIIAKSIGNLVAKKRRGNLTRNEWKRVQASTLNKEFISEINVQVKNSTRE